MTSERPEVASVEAVREELRRLGYLDSGLDRFVLAGAGAPSPLRACARAALRVGLAGGVLFGLAGTAGRRRPRSAPARRAARPRGAHPLPRGGGRARRGPRRLRGRPRRRLGRDAGRRARPGPTFARNLGLFFAVAGLFYLTFWFRTHLLGASLWAQARRARARASASAWPSAASPPWPRWRCSSRAAWAAACPKPRSRAISCGRCWWPRPLLLGGGVAAASFFGRDEARSGPDFAVVPTGLRIRLVGIDGLERRMTEQMLARRRDAAPARAHRRGGERLARRRARARARHRVDHHRHRPRARGPRHPEHGCATASRASRPRGPWAAKTARSSPPWPRPATSCGSRAPSPRRPCCAP